ncbi:Long-chain-fatty-acid--CoA ligase [Fulvivirga imtechensis AK7]|uniref:Long-chain-fatty-acid--CoA ligase n=1 Tax=Fulvivirga imtechensis AK7 TaxID=1237149 RepID=L8JNY3_9BACT|nr:long-chain fatty acid--CoA ligase [Fulvivirga imtechensis]ELR70671.1 Long-chain-fatty-acid--CoA ligase [Fulvivirga imtechensis AK7]
MEITRLFDILQYQLTHFPKQDALACKVRGQWKKYATAEVVEVVNQLSTGLLALGVKKGDKIALASFNRPEWVFADYAIQQIGAINIPMYPNSTAEDYAFIMNDAEVKIAFAGDAEIAHKIRRANEQLTDIVALYTFDKIEGTPFWQEALKPVTENDLSEIEGLKGQINYEDLATIIYTSGTTGNPKGVMLSHKNILSNSRSVHKAFAMGGPEHRTISFLPLCHIFERTALYTYMQMGVSIYYAESMETIGDNIREIKPHFFATVPRVLEKVYEKIVTKGYELKGLKKSLFFWALELAKKYDMDKNQGAWYNLQLSLANKLIFSKWREALGNNIEFIVSGGAALQPRLGHIFWAAKIKVLEAYGLTETSPGVSFSRLDAVKIGTVGPLLDGVQVKIAEDGEILVKGDNVMMGYYKRQEATAEVMTGDWFHTGDIGEMVDGTFLKITDRKKEMFKTSGGKYIAPQPLENKFVESMIIDQVMVVGEGEKFPGALIVPNFEKLKDYCHRHRLHYTTNEQMIEHPEVIKKYESELETMNESFAQYEKIKKFRLLSQPWTIDKGEITPKLSLKRKVIKQHYQHEIDKIYEKVSA